MNRALLDAQRPFPPVIDANPYGFLTNLARVPQISLTETAELLRLDSQLPVPLFRSTFAVHCGSTAALRAFLDRDGPGPGPWWLGPSTTPTDPGLSCRRTGCAPSTSSR